MSALNNEQVQQRQGTAAQDGANLVINATTGFAGPSTSEAGGITFPPLPNRTSPPAGSPATGAAVVTTAIQQNITPLQQQMAEQSQLLASMAKVITAGQNPAATVLSPAQAAAASVAPDKAKRSKEKRKKKEESSSSSSSSSSDDEAPERLRRLVDRIEAQQPTDPSGFRKQIFHGFATQGKLALALLAEDPPNVKGATKVLKPLIRRAEVGMAVTNTLAAEPRIGLAAADICFSILCNEDKLRDKTKPRKLVDGVKDQALKRAASRSGGAKMMPAVMREMKSGGVERCTQACTPLVFAFLRAAPSFALAVWLCARAPSLCACVRVMTLVVKLPLVRGQGLGLLWRVLEHACACLSWPVLHVYEFLQSLSSTRPDARQAPTLRTCLEGVGDQCPCPFLDHLAARAGALLAPLGDCVTADLQALAVQLAQEAPESLAARTTKDYATVWRQFRSWWEAHNFPWDIYSTPGELVALYLLALLNTSRADGVGPGRVRLASAAISTYFRMAGKATPTEHAACGIVCTLAEKRLHGRPLQRDALEPEDIAALARLVEGPEVRLDYLMMVAAVAIMFAGFFRFDDAAEICVHVDLLLISASHMEIFIPRSKTDQLMRGHWVVIARSGGPCCPVGLTERLLELGGYRRQPVSVDEDVGPLLRPVQWTQRGGYLSGPLTGGNSMAADRGVPAELRKAHGHWCTDAMVQHYTRRDTAAKLEVSRRLGLAAVYMMVSR
ncbi:hypothetical protein VOLCADRAFT_100749 [Volvox carteri f. nagariensis]|uniref:Uncharacterized protein n=1 Tax=Volvox carteri f. nagariensis TaxID=3068 RepID=D8UKX9_VOLCA|nr:uncharacterized protein VOLCADRAFT_100749 [Volvox carteri f. nagariensis]EFJ39619.1 hypothetical protein VOLCADRAFT_100749 [Volvox carteri f. nagariensis]|eukprot:XP_002959315.1 hypothetical protein VOLCADRAFT_100749 [Volvox carteri f. nagariensis]